MISSTTKPVSCAETTGINPPIIRAAAIIRFILLCNNFKIFVFKSVFINLVFKLLRKLDLPLVQDDVLDLIRNELKRRYIVRDPVFIDLQEVKIIFILGLKIWIALQELHFVRDLHEGRISHQVIEDHPGRIRYMVGHRKTQTIRLEALPVFFVLGVDPVLQFIHFRCVFRHLYERRSYNILFENKIVDVVFVIGLDLRLIKDGVKILLYIVRLILIGDNAIAIVEYLSLDFSLVDIDFSRSFLDQ